MIKNRIAGTAALATFGLAVLGGIALAAPGSADAGSGRSSSGATGASSPSGVAITPGSGYAYSHPAATRPTSKLGSSPTSTVSGSGGAVAGSTSSSNAPATANGSTSPSMTTFGPVPITPAFGLGSDDVSAAQLEAMLKQMANNPPNQADLVMLDALTLKWQGLVQSETGVAKKVGDMMKAVAMNIGS